MCVCLSYITAYNNVRKTSLLKKHFSKNLPLHTSKDIQLAQLDKTELMNWESRNNKYVCFVVSLCYWNAINSFMIRGLKLCIISHLFVWCFKVRKKKKFILNVWTSEFIKQIQTRNLWKSISLTADKTEK